MSNFQNMSIEYDSEHVASNYTIELKDGAFSGLIATSLDIQVKVTLSGPNIFAGSYVSRISLPNTISEIPDYTFLACPFLETLSFNGEEINHLPSSITRIGQSAFESCTALAEIYIPNQTSYIGKNAFEQWGTSLPQVIHADCFDPYSWDSQWLGVSGQPTLKFKESTVIFDKADGIGGTDTVTVSYGNDMPSADMPQKEGYIFQGYFSGENGQGIQFYDKNMNSVSKWDDKQNKIYAFWGDKKCKIILGYSYTKIITNLRERKMVKTKKLLIFGLMAILLPTIAINVVSHPQTAFADELHTEEVGYNYLGTENVERQADSFVENGILATGTDDFYNLVRYEAYSKSIDKFYFNDRIYSTSSFANAMQNDLKEELQTQPNSVSSSVIYDFSREPYKSICLFQSCFNTTAQGTGFLVGGDFLLTAGHCVYNNGSFCTSAQIFIKAYNSSGYGLEENEYETSAKIIYAYIPKEYYESEDEKYDWALCILDTEFNDRGLELAPSEGSSPVSTTGYQIGYPSAGNMRMYSEPITVISCTDRQIKYDALNTMPGYSGSPLLTNSYRVQGIVARLVDASYATRITPFINAFITELRNSTYVKISNSYYEGTSKIRYNCLVHVYFTQPSYQFVWVNTSDGKTLRRDPGANDFFTSTGSSATVPFNYVSYYTQNMYTGGSSATTYINYGSSEIRTLYTLKGRTGEYVSIPTSYDEDYNLWEHGGDTGQTIKGTVVYKGIAKNIEVTIPWIGYKSSSIQIGDVEFSLRTGPNKVSIKASKKIITDANNLFAFGVN